ncbi:VP2 [Scorpion polyomavirus 3]|nr:VP2 [Scorpion polyomavirus 3]
MGAVSSTIGAVVMLLVEEFAATGTIAGSAAAIGVSEASVEATAGGALADLMIAAGSETAAGAAAGGAGLFSGSSLTSGLDLLADLALEGTSAGTATAATAGAAESAATASETALGGFFANTSVKFGIGAGIGTAVAIGSAAGLGAYFASNNTHLNLSTAMILLPTIDQAGNGLFVNLYFRKKTKTKRHAESEEGMLPKLYKRKKVQSY